MLPIRAQRHPGGCAIGRLRRLVDGYDTGIRYMDTHIGQLLAALEEAGALDDPVIIVTSTANLGSWVTPARMADDITCRVPLIVTADYPKGVDRGLHYQPTCCRPWQSCCRPVKPWWDGVSNAAARRGRAGARGTHPQPCHVPARCVWRLSLHAHITTATTSSRRNAYDLAPTPEQRISRSSAGIMPRGAWRLRCTTAYRHAARRTSDPLGRLSTRGCSMPAGTSGGISSGQGRGDKVDERRGATRAVASSRESGRQMAIQGIFT